MPLVESSCVRVIAIGASAGGVPLLRHVVAAFPADLSASVLIVQHLFPRGPSRLAWLLARAAALPVRQAADGAAITAGSVCVAVPDRHLVIRDGRLALSSSDPVHHVRPSFDRLLISMADAYGPACAAVVLSGTGLDGADGVIAVKRAGGTTIAQEPSTAEFGGMPAAAVRTGCIDHVLPVGAIAPLLVRLTPPAAVSEA